MFPRIHQFLLVPSLVRLPRQRCAFNKLPAPDLARGTTFQKPGVTSCLLGLSDMPEARLVDNVHRYEPLWGPKGFLLCYNGCTVLLTSKYEPNVWFMNKLAFRLWDLPVCRSLSDDKRPESSLLKGWHILIAHLLHITALSAFLSYGYKLILSWGCWENKVFVWSLFLLSEREPARLWKVLGASPCFWCALKSH